MVKTAHFTRSNRLLRSIDFKILSRWGERAAGRHFVILWAFRPTPDLFKLPRIGITVSRKVGNAVVRNRIKRRVREWYRQEQNNLGRNLDIVVIARPSAANLGTRETWVVLQQMMGRTAVDASSKVLE